MHEIVVNLHMHTRYSDGSGTHKDIAQAAIQAGLDAVIVTDHNVLVQGLEGYYRSAGRPSYHRHSRFLNGLSNSWQIAPPARAGLRPVQVSPSPSGRVLLL